jgi:MFS superfamily sulfate permease-like transporter
MYSSKLPSLSSLENWKLIAGYGGALFATTFTETAIALNVVDRLDETQGPGAMVLIGQGFSNIVSAVMGGMGGSGVVTSSVLADRTFGTTCLSTFFTGFIVFVCIFWGYPIIDYIPLSAISGISISMVCSFIQWRSIVAIFATVLPNARRESLPPQYNVARTDIFFMLFVTAACLVLDVATLAVFVIAALVYMIQAARSQCCVQRGNKRQIQRSNSRSSMDGSRHSRRYSGNYDEENSHYNEGIEVSPSGTIVDELLNNIPNPAVATAAATSSILDQAEQIIFPVDTTESESVY